MFPRAREDVERAALAEKRARAAAEAARVAAAQVPAQHQEDMIQAHALLQASVHGLEGR